MKKFSLVLLTLIGIKFSGFCGNDNKQTYDTVLYQNDKRIGILPKFPLNYFIAIKGKLTITLDSVFFEPHKLKHEKYLIEADLNSIDSVKKWGAFIIPNPYFIPNMVKIWFKNGSKTTIYTGRDRKKVFSYLSGKK